MSESAACALAAEPPPAPPTGSAAPSSQPPPHRAARGEPAAVPIPSLTAREREVALLVAQGCTNRQIAEKLVVTTGTAALHVEHIRRKLGFHARSQIATWVTTQDWNP
jgi:DNA-binding NarL/FixJ family response regulator